MSEANPAIPARYRARAILRECQALVRRLLEANAALAARAGGAPASLQPAQVAAKLVERQAALRAVVDELVQHQRQHAALDALRAAVAAEDARLAQLSGVLRAAEAALQDARDGAAGRLAAVDKAARPVDVAEVVSYGSRIAAGLAAPPAWDPAAGLAGALPPAPGEDMMRAGKLAKMERAETAGEAREGAGGAGAGAAPAAKPQQ
jgi:hypothetical protein